MHSVDIAFKYGKYMYIISYGGRTHFLKFSDLFLSPEAGLQDRNLKHNAWCHLDYFVAWGLIFLF